jgi:hypothetical protein
MREANEGKNAGEEPWKVEGAKYLQGIKEGAVAYLSFPQLKNSLFY